MAVAVKEGFQPPMKAMMDAHKRQMITFCLNGVSSLNQGRKQNLKCNIFLRLILPYCHVQPEHACRLQACQSGPMQHAETVCCTYIASVQIQILNKYNLTIIVNLNPAPVRVPW